MSSLNSPKKSDIEIDHEDLELIMGSDINKLDIFLSNVFCSTCPPPFDTTIINYEIYVNDYNDLIFMGSCKKCGEPVARYVEIGEHQNKSEVAKHIKMVIKKYRTV